MSLSLTISQATSTLCLVKKEKLVMKKQLIAVGTFLVLGLGALPSLAACPCASQSFLYSYIGPRCAAPLASPCCCPAAPIRPCCPKVQPCCPAPSCCDAPCPCPCPAAPVDPCCDKPTCNDCCD